MSFSFSSLYSDHPRDGPPRSPGHSKHKGICSSIHHSHVADEEGAAKELTVNFQEPPRVIEESEIEAMPLHFGFKYEFNEILPFDVQKLWNSFQFEEQRKIY